MREQETESRVFHKAGTGTRGATSPIAPSPVAPARFRGDPGTNDELLLPRCCRGSIASFTLPLLSRDSPVVYHIVSDLSIQQRHHIAWLP